MYKVLIVEDDKTISNIVGQHLSRWGYQVQQVQDFRHVMEEFAVFDPHIVLLDIGLPYFNGHHWCSEIRRISQVPVIFLSSADDNMNIVMALNMGSDDFISKPFDLNVITAKIQALCRRTYSFREQTSLMEHNGAVLNLSDATLTWKEEKIELTRNEYRILQCLMARVGEIVSRDEIMRALGGSMKQIIEYLKLRRKILLLFLVCTGIFALFFYLSRAPLDAVLYAGLLCLTVLAAVGGYEYYHFQKKYKALKRLTEIIDVHIDELPEPSGCVEQAYTELIRELYSQKREAESKARLEKKDLADYFSMWTHQIKTPIAAMSLILQQKGAEAGEDDKDLVKELFQIEEYVDCVMSYIRIQDISADLQFDRVPLDRVIRKPVKKYAGIFIRKKMRLDFQDTGSTAVTDEKMTEGGFVGVDINQEDWDKAGAAVQKLQDEGLRVDNRKRSESDVRGVYGGLLFIGIFLGLLFLLATVMIIYYKQITEGYEDHDRYEIMQKVGMSLSEVKSSIRSQILIVFFLPLAAAVCHVAASFNMMSKLQYYSKGIL